VIILPIFCSIISLACAIVMGRDAQRRPRPDKIVWALAFLMFALAAGTDAAGRSLGWNEVLARLYYATGPALVVMYLAIGELYLLAPERMKRFGVGATALCTAFWVALVLNAPIDGARLADDGWEAIERNGFMVLVTVLINSIGTCIIVGGTIWSAWRFQRRGIMRNRMIGCLLIALGTLAVAAGGSLTRLGHYEYLYIAMSVGVAIIFAGVLWTRRPDAASQPGVESSASVALAAAGVGLVLPEATASDFDLEGVAVMTDAAVPVVGLGEGSATALGFIERSILVLDDAGIDRLCSEWSVPRDSRPVMERGEARAIWAFRAQLNDEALPRFDRLAVPARRQIAELHACVLAPDEMPSRTGSLFEHRVAAESPAEVVRPIAPVPFPTSAGLQPTMTPFVPDEDDDLHFPYA
jgi:hypothetical protein